MAKFLRGSTGRAVDFEILSKVRHEPRREACLCANAEGAGASTSLSAQPLRIPRRRSLSSIVGDSAFFSPTHHSLFAARILVSRHPCHLSFPSFLVSVARRVLSATSGAPGSCAAVGPPALAALPSPLGLGRHFGLGSPAGAAPRTRSLSIPRTLSNLY